MSTIPTCPPRRFVAGDTVQFYIQNQTYPASLYTMQFILFSSAGDDPDSFAGVAQADGSFLVSITPSQTATVLPEEYTAVYVYTSIAIPATRNSITGPIVWVIPDLTQQLTPSPNQVLLTALQDAMLKLAAGTIMSATINQQTWTKKSLSQLQAQINILTSQVRAEKAQLDALLNHPDASQAVVKFEFGGGCGYPWPQYASPWNGGCCQ